MQELWLKIGGGLICEGGGVFEGHYGIISGASNRSGVWWPRAERG